MQYKKILVTMDMSEKDRDVIEYMAYINKFFKCDQMFFIHVTPEHDLPEEIHEQYPELATATDAEIKHAIKEKVFEVFPESGKPEITFYIREGNAVEKILTAAKHDDIDLLVLGRRGYLEHGMTSSIDLAQKTHCSVLVIPAGSQHKISRILVPIDFSGCSLLAAEQAINISVHSKKDIPIIFLHVYYVPTGYAKTGKTYEEFARIMESNATKQYKEFVKKLEFGKTRVEPVFILSSDIEASILDKTYVSKSDLIVMGDRGKSPTAALLLGSSSEKLIYKTRVPLLIVKKKGANMGLLDVILNL